MNLKIGVRIGLGFGVILLAVIANAFLTANSLQTSRKVNEEITNIYSPSLDLINALEKEINGSRMLIKSWVHIDTKSNTPDKRKLRKLHSEEYPLINDSITKLSAGWIPEHQQLFRKINTTITDTLFPMHLSIMSQLNSFDDYEDFFNVSMTTMMVEDNGDVIIYTNKILDMITDLRGQQEDLVIGGQERMIKTFDNFRQIIIVMLIALIAISVLIAAFTINSLVKPINKTKNILLTLSKGKIIDSTLREGKDEIGQMGVALNSLIASLKNIAAFTVQIGKGNFDSDYKTQSDEDNIGQALLQMREELKLAKQEEEKRQEENRQRTWSSQGIGLFSDILRKNNDNLEQLTYEIISNLVDYTNSNQGGIFLVNDNDTDHVFLEMKACFAYDRQKFLKKTIEVGEGLIGRCYQEKEKIFLLDMPKNYLKITSGLGSEIPKSLLLVPLAYNNKIYGIIEIASFNVYPDYQVEFIERIGESIAATISSVLSNIQTSELLETTRQQAEEMHSQEEEMRQNMEELRATQEQSTRREDKLRNEVENLKKRIRDLQSST